MAADALCRLRPIAAGVADGACPRHPAVAASAAAAVTPAEATAEAVVEVVAGEAAAAKSFSSLRPAGGEPLAGHFCCRLA